VNSALVKKTPNPAKATSSPAKATRSPARVRDNPVKVARVTSSSPAKREDSSEHPYLL
jgi:hypothetical protein